MTVEWLEVQDGVGSGAICIDYVPSNAANQAVIRNNMVRNCSGQSIRLSGPQHHIVADINNNVIYRGAREGIRVDSLLGTGTGSRVRIFNNTFLRNNGARPLEHRDQHRRDAEPLRRPAQQHPGGRRAGAGRHLERVGSLHERRQLRLVERGQREQHHGRRGAPDRPVAARHRPEPAGTGVASATEASLSFVNTTATSENLHIQSGSAAWNRGRT